MTDDPTVRRDDALRTALALIENYGQHDAEEALIAGVEDEAQLMRVLSSAVLAGRHQAEQWAVHLGVPLADVLQALRDQLTERL
jgi:hypothetical protein